MLVLYWATSAWVSVVQNMILHRIYEPVVPARTCTSPDRMGLVNRTQMRQLKEKGDRWGGYWGQRKVVGGLEKKERDD